MLTVKDVDRALDDYISQIVPAMLRRNYHLLLVKGGPEYPHLSEQSHFSHIINGVFGVTRLVKFLIAHQIDIRWLNEETFRKGLALYTIHDVHKDSHLELLGPSEFSIPLERLREEYQGLGLGGFAQEVSDHLLRAVNVHKRSSKQGDLLLSDDVDAANLWLFVRIADTLASSNDPEEAASSLQGYLSDLTPAFVPRQPPGQYALYYHETKDLRGVLTNVIHHVVTRQLEVDLGFFPLLFFSTGTLYIGPKRADFKTSDNIIKGVVDQILQSLQQEEGTDAIRGALRPQKSDFETYVYAFATIDDLLTVILENTLTASPDPEFVQEEIASMVRKRRDLPPDWSETIEDRLGIKLLDPKEYKTFNELWSRVYHYLLYVDTLLRDLNPGNNRLDWLVNAFSIPQPLAVNLLREAEIWSRGGIGKYVLIIAYHFLRGPDFADRPAETFPPEEVLSRLHQRILREFQNLDTQTGRQAKVSSLGFREDLEAYLSEHLYLSFDPSSRLHGDGYASYTKPKRKGHSGKICSLCNRSSNFTQELRTGILDDFGRVYSNRVLPSYEAPQKNRIWCPICHLEAVLRKLLGMGLPSGAHYKKSQRIYIYVLPTYSFTPEHLRLFEPLLRNFQRTTNLPIRDYGQDLGVPHYWLEKRSMDPEWFDQLQTILAREAEKIAGWGGRNFVGERVMLARIKSQPHYYLIVWEKNARETESNDARIATRTEAWAKALLASTIIYGLTSCKIYITERPYLPVADPAGFKPTIILDSPPTILRGLIGRRTDFISLYGRESQERSGLEQVLDISAAIWTVTSDLQPNKDKHIAGRLERLNVDPLSGAHFYKEYGRENDGLSPSRPFDMACKILLDYFGGELMDLVERIARKSLEIALPFGGSGRGKARRYELVFREAVSAMRKAQQVIPEMREGALGSKQPSDQTIEELKRLMAGTLQKGLERRQESRRGEVFIRALGSELTRLVGEFVDIIVDELYLNRAGGNFARFLRLENSMADGIYYFTDRNISQYWNEYKQQKNARIEFDSY